MRKEIIFLRIGEKRNEQSFVRKVGRIINILIEEKTTCESVYKSLGMSMQDQDEEDAFDKYLQMADGYPKKPFMAVQKFTPESGVQLCAIFEVREIEEQKGELPFEAQSPLEAQVYITLEESKKKGLEVQVIATAMRLKGTGSDYDSIMALQNALAHWS